MNLKVVMVLTATVALAGCASTQNTELATLHQHDKLQLDYTVRNGYRTQNYQWGPTREQYQNGYFVVFDVSENQAPRIINIQRSRPVVEDWKDKEILFVTGDLSEVQPDWRTWYDYSEDLAVFTCMKGALRSAEGNHRNDYNPCDSTLAEDFKNNADTRFNAFVGVFSFGASAVTGTTQYSVKIAISKVAALVENTRMMAALQVRQMEIAKQEAEAERLRAERAEIARLEEERQQQIRERQRQIEAEAMERRRQQAAIERQQREVEYTRWRRTLAVGSSTFCGFVIERNGPMFKIAVNTPLPGYASEQWLRVEEIYPPQLGCRNRNGILSTVADP